MFNSSLGIRLSPEGTPGRLRTGADSDRCCRQEPDSIALRLASRHSARSYVICLCFSSHPSLLISSWLARRRILAFLPRNSCANSLARSKKPADGISLLVNTARADSMKPYSRAVALEVSPSNPPMADPRKGHPAVTPRDSSDRISESYPFFGHIPPAHAGFSLFALPFRSGRWGRFSRE